METQQSKTGIMKSNKEDSKQQVKEKKAVQKVYKSPASGPLLEILIAMFPHQSRTTLKSYLAHRQVMVGHSIQSKFDAPVRENETITLFPNKRTEELKHPMLSIVYEDNHIIVVDKKCGLLSMGTEKERTKTAYYILSDYIKQDNPRNRIFILHRLDRETSGVMVFAKDEFIQQEMQSHWDEAIPERTYIAIVEGVPAKEEDIISTYLTENKNFKVFVSNEQIGDLATTRYHVVKKGDNFSMLELNLETGRKNQIRAHLEWLGHPIIGDKKYGATTNPIKRVALHAATLVIKHPISGEIMRFSSPLPQKFKAVLKE